MPNMKMPRPLLTALFVLHLILLPSEAFPSRSWFNPFGTGYEIGPEGDGQQVFETDQGEGGELLKPVEQQLVDVNQLRDQEVEPKDPAVEVQETQGKNNNEGGGEQKKKADEKPAEANNDKKPAEANNDKKPAEANNDNNLKVGFYDKSCPNAEKIVADWMRDVAKTNANAMANLLRLAFHDCFVGGCDASVLLDYVPAADKVEKSSLFNGVLLKGTEIIDDLKAKLEEECPQTVSCADTLAFATNEAMAMAGGVRQRPLGGRRDSIVSLASIAEDNNLPLPTWNVDQMVDLFKRKGFTPEEMVILLGAHSIGAAHCDLFMDRVYNFMNSQKPDPTLPLPVVDEFKLECANPGTALFRNPLVNFDETPYSLDNLFFRNLVEKNKSLLLSDSFLLGDPRTGPTVKQMAAEPELFPKKFAEALTKMISMNVLTGKDGEVRKTCRSTN